VRANPAVIAAYLGERAVRGPRKNVDWLLFAEFIVGLLSAACWR
jgi:hypothetical protein